MRRSMVNPWVVPFLAFLVTMVGCKRNPVDRLTNPVADGAVPQFSGVYTVYDDELKTGGGLGFIPGGENQEIDLTDQSAPRSGTNQIRYAWNGQDIFDPDTQLSGHTFAGFSLLVSPDFSTIGTHGARDLTAPGYTQVKFRVRGALSADNALRIEGPGSDPPAFTPARVELTASQLTSAWQEILLPVPNATHFSRVKVFLTVSIQYSQPPRTTSAGHGGVIYMDNIRYEQ